MAGSSPGGANPGGQGGMAGGAPAPSDLLLYKLVERGTEFEAVLGYAELPDMRAEAEQLASDGYVITTALWDTLFSNQDMRYLAFKPTGSTTTYQVVLGYEQLPDMQAEATRLAAEGYVITTALWDTLFSDEDLRFLAFKPVGSTTTYEAVLGYEQLPDMQAEATRLAAEGYVITTALWDTVFSDEDLRFFAFKPVGSMAARQAVVGYAELPDMQAEATQVATDGYVITTALWDTLFSNQDMRYFAISR
jgi:predicted phosphatase